MTHSSTDTTSGPERKRGSGVKIVYDVLRDEILDLVLPPGSPIDEVQLAERFKLSRTPIREALVRLAGEGLIDTLPNRSTMVSNIDFLNLHTYFDALVLMYRVTTRLAAEYHRPEDLDPIRARQAEFAAAVEAQDALAMIATNAAFHSAIAEAGRNLYFTGLFNRLLDEGRRILRLYYQSYDDRLPQRFVDEHEEMIAAIAARDVEAADRLARTHAEQIVEQIQKLFARNGRLDISLTPNSVDK
ncbi:Transcriptional regulator, GntR family (plasmid) [Sinorhizobium sojae CCBAU 05684]|uniref:Transcriptional regulator, GntR family n=1 Tax=Sinorhizobium sojae CCBAU 05684 TaxID=716928 RepID=A0A249PMK3_9HYPH|nr:GntR family transcriptional regulator [Sinorhizobium sojae]ASY66987.1 Transcriptional regulator, GntR family [Sinorhizobium sojae CCBAU 05684]